MCGRYSLAAELDAVADVFSLDAGRQAAGYGPRWNVAPGQDVLVVTGDGGRRRGRFFRWGFPAGPGAPPGRGPWINARSESAGTRPAFRESLRRRRCLVPADGFFEWTGLPARSSGRQPYWLRPARGGLFAMAGIWRPAGADPAKGREAGRPGMAVLTQAAPAALAWLHDRVPVILPSESWSAWLSTDAPAASLLPALRAEPPQLVARAVSRTVNDARFDGPECVEEAPPVRQEQLSLF